MSNKKINFLQIGIAILFAAAIILSNFLIKGSEHSDTILFVLIALWFVPYLYLSKLKNKNRKEKIC
jgi:phosphatidylserine synthase